MNPSSMLRAAAINLCFVLNPLAAFAASATWNVNATGDWNVPSNWTPVTVPNGASDVATFDFSNAINVGLSASVTVSELHFGVGTTAYVITSTPFHNLTLVGSGIINLSGMAQQFIAQASLSGGGGGVIFTNSATVGGMISITTEGGLQSGNFGGHTEFHDSSSAGQGSFTIGGGTTDQASGGYMQFFNNSGAGQAVFDIRGPSVAGAGGSFINFLDTSSAASANFTVEGGQMSGADRGYIQFLSNSTAGNSSFTIQQNEAGGLAGAVYFRTQSTADHAILVLNGGLATYENGGSAQFLDTSTAGSANFTLNGGLGMETFGGLAQFFANSTAANASFTVNGGSMDLQAYGSRVEFFAAATAGTASFHINGTSASMKLTARTMPPRAAIRTSEPAIVALTTGGAVHFNETSMAGSGNFVNEGGAFSGADGSLVFFSDTSSADHATFNCEAATADGGSGAQVDFADSSTAGNGTFFMSGSSFKNGGYPSIVFSNESSAGDGMFTSSADTVVFFEDNSTAANGNFTFEGLGANGFYGSECYFGSTSNAGMGVFLLNGSTTNTTLSNVAFFDAQSSAGNSHFTLGGGTVDGANGSEAYFGSQSTAADSTFVFNGATAAGGVGGLLTFFDSSTAANATLIAHTGMPGPRGGGRIYFEDDATGGTCNLQIFGIAKVDLSLHNPGAVQVGSIQGDGNIFLGALNLAAGANNASTTFSGPIQDGGSGGGSGGSLTKIGNGVLTLNGTSGYTGGTTLTSGGLIAAYDAALGTGNVIVAASRTLTLQGGTTNNYIGDVATLSFQSSSTVNLNFSGNPDVVGFLVIGGVQQPPGLYGSPTSGAPHPLPEFTGPGTVFVTNPHAVSRKVHGTQTFDVDLPFLGQPFIECRSGGATGDYQMVVTFASAVSFDSATVQSGIGKVANASGSGTNSITIDLTGVADQQTIQVAISNVNYGANIGNVVIPMSILIGDTTGNGSVNSSDIGQIKAHVGELLSTANFREDLNVNGTINSSDIGLAKANSGHALEARSAKGAHEPAR